MGSQRRGREGWNAKGDGKKLQSGKERKRRQKEGRA